MKLFTTLPRIKGRTFVITEKQMRLLKEDEQDKFKPDAEWMLDKYNEMNSKLFGGSLGWCQLTTFTSGKGASGGTLGRFRMMGHNLKIRRSDRRIFQYKYSTSYDTLWDEMNVYRDNFEEACVPRIELNGNYAATEDAWTNTLVHEMCHYYTYMYGLAPKQPHGIEFREIASVVSSRSNGEITIQRLATAEEMVNYELDADIKAKNDARKERQNSRTMIIVIVMRDKQVRLVLTTSDKVLDDIEQVHVSRGNSAFMGMTKNDELLSLLHSKGYRGTMRTYRYWTVTDENILDSMCKADWKCFDSVSDYKSLSEALGKKQDNDTNTTNSKEDEFHLGYKIIKDNDKYNMVDKSGRRSWGKPVDKIWFDNTRNEFMVKNGKFTYSGTPGHWTKVDTVDESIDAELTEEIVDEYNVGDNEDAIDINSNMNLGIMSPIEMSL